jgi:hypothetical protein
MERLAFQNLGGPTVLAQRSGAIDATFLGTGSHSLSRKGCVTMSDGEAWGSWIQATARHLIRERRR